MDIVHLLLEKNVNVNVADNALNTALILAVRHNQEEVTKLLIDSKANIDAQNRWQKKSALFYAAKQGNLCVFFDP